MDDCVFCKIVRGELPSYRVYENDLFLAFLDINPVGVAHTQVIPKKHYRWVNDVPEFGRYWETALKVSQALGKGLGATKVNYLVSGEEVPHAHIWVIPRFENDQEMLSIKRMAEPLSKERMTEIAKQISSQLPQE